MTTFVSACSDQKKDNNIVTTKEDSTIINSIKPTQIVEISGIDKIKKTLNASNFVLAKDTSEDNTKLFYEYFSNFAKYRKIDVSSCQSFKKVIKYSFIKKGIEVKNDTRYLSPGLNKMIALVHIRDIEFNSSLHCNECYSNAIDVFNRTLFPYGSAYHEKNHIYYIEAGNQNDTPSYIEVDSIVKSLMKIQPNSSQGK